jgi:hypothetical protein
LGEILSVQPDDLVSQFIDFLRSFKNSESLSPQLRVAISVRTNLHAILLDVCAEGRTILLTGSAGSGKTHLLHAIISELEPKARILRVPDKVSKPYVLVVEDATELSTSERIAFIRPGDRQCVCKIMAINEGPLREAAKASGGEFFAAAMKLLHDGQRGVGAAYDPNKPTVIDMRAYDPLEEGLLSSLLDLSILRKAIIQISPDENSPRRKAWAMLDYPSVRNRIAAVAKLAKLAQPEWLFRDIWDFVADLALGGDDESDVPTSPWFWRLFFGDSLISRAILSVASPDRYALPFLESRIWYGDWMSNKIKLVSATQIMPIGRPENSHDAFMWAKVQILLLTEHYEFDQAVLGSADERLTASVERGDTTGLIKQINDYVTFGLGETNQTSLDLWVDHRVERRTKTHAGLMKLGSAPANEFAIQKSLVALNHPNQDASLLRGTHAFLVHQPTRSVFSLDRRRLGTLERARSTRLADREHVDFVWDLYRFFDAVLAVKATGNILEVYQADVERSRFFLRRYAISVQPPRIEPRI